MSQWPRSWIAVSVALALVAMAAGLVAIQVKAGTPQASESPLQSIPPSGTASAQQQSYTVTVVLNTGYVGSAPNSTPIAVGLLDDDWKVVRDDNPFGPLGRAANVVAPYQVGSSPPSWEPPLAGSQWISVSADHGSGLVANQVFQYEFAFQLPADCTSAKLSAEFRADEGARLFLNGVYIGGPSAPYNNKFAPGSFAGPPLMVTASGPFNFNALPAGNKLMAEIIDTGAVATGFNLAGTLTAQCGRELPLPPVQVYSTKFVCGVVQPRGPKPSLPTLTDPLPVVPGVYRTSVNVHNFSEEPVTVTKKAVIALSQRERRGAVSRKVEEKLGPNEALGVDCVDILSLSFEAVLAQVFLEGFLEITSPVELQVTAVYTVEELLEQGISIDVEQVPPHIKRVRGEPKTGRIIVDKVTKPPVSAAQPPEIFNFSASYNLPGFSLTDISPPNDSGPLPPGTYSVKEAVPAGWQLTSATCSDGSPVNAIALDPGETVTCTFINTRIVEAVGKILIIKDAVPDDPQDFAFSVSVPGSGPFLLDDDPTSALPNQQSFVLPPGMYIVAEMVPAGWQLTSAICSDGSPVSAIALDPGETVTCTFTNTRIEEKTGRIIVDKVTKPPVSTAQPPVSFNFSASYNLSGFSLTDISLPNDSGPLPPGTYSVEEKVPAGWQLTSATCSDGSPASAIALDPGETVTCTFTNTRIEEKTGRIIVDKVTKPSATAGEQPQSFDFSASYNLSGFSLTDISLPNDSGPLPPGTYSVEEKVPAGWQLTAATCSDGSPVSAIVLDPGETVTCTFTNTRSGAAG